MDDKNKSPFDLLAGLLATMTARAIKAEHERDEALKSADDWFQQYRRKSEQHKNMENVLIDAKATIRRLEQYIKQLEEGAQHG